MRSFVIALALVVACSSDEYYPYIVSIHRNSKTRDFLCSGSLIASSWVLTTANCLPKIACKIRYGDMITVDAATYSKILKRIPHMSSRSVYSPDTPRNRLTPKSNNIGLAFIQEILNNPIAMVSGVDYSTVLSRQVTIFEFNFMPVYKSKIYEINRKRVVRFDKKRKQVKKKYLFARFEGDDTGDAFPPRITKVLKVATGMAILCPDKQFAGPNICVSNKCFDIDEQDPRTSIVTPDYGGPLVHGGLIVGVTTEVEDSYSRFTPVSPYIDWISKQMSSNTDDCD